MAPSAPRNLSVIRAFAGGASGPEVHLHTFGSGVRFANAVLIGAAIYKWDPLIPSLW